MKANQPTISPPQAEPTKLLVIESKETPYKLPSVAVPPKLTQPSQFRLPVFFGARKRAQPVTAPVIGSFLASQIPDGQSAKSLLLKESQP